MYVRTLRLSDSDDKKRLLNSLSELQQRAVSCIAERFGNATVSVHEAALDPRACLGLLDLIELLNLPEVPSHVRKAAGLDYVQRITRQVANAA
jgi:hypothetical protein